MLRAPWSRLSERVSTTLAARRRWVLAGFALLMVLAAVGAARLAPVQDVTAFLSEDAGEEHRVAARVLKDFGTLDTLLVDVSREGASPAEIEALGDATAAALKSTGDFRAVHFRVDAREQEHLLRVLFPRRFYLLPPPEELGPAMEAARRDLMLPGGLDQLVTRDPLAHRHALADLLQAAVPQMRVDASAGTLLSTDRQHALIVAEPVARALDVPAADAMLARVRAAAPEGAQVEVLGAHVFASAAAQGIRRDVRVTVGATIALVIVLFGLAFRHPGPVLAVALPVASGGLLAAGIIGWLGLPLHGITLGFGAMLVGIGVDYGAHLVVHLRSRAAERPEEALPERIRAVLTEILPSLSLGLVTTLAAFAALLMAGTRALSEMVLFTGLGVLGSFAVTVLILPLGARWFGRPPAPSEPARHYPRRRGHRRPAWTLATVVAGCLVLLTGLPRVSFDGDIRNLDHQPESVRTLEARFAERYENPRFPTLVVTRGEDVADVLRRGTRLTALLAQAEQRGDVGSWMSAARVLPSEEAQRRMLARYDPETLRPRIERAADEAGLSADAFEPFFADLAAAREGTVPPLRPDELTGTPLQRLRDRTLVVGPHGAELLWVVYMSGARSGARELPASLRDALTALGGVTVISPAGLARAAVRSIQGSVARLSLLSLVFVTLILLAYYRSATAALYALSPVLVGFACSFGLMGLLEVPLNIVSVGAFALVAGVGVDYGIFVTDAALRGGTGLALTRRAVVLAASTTLVGFGTLLLARSPVMWSLGFAVSAGVLTSLLVATVALPAAWARFGPPVRRRECPECGVALRRVPDRAAGAQLAVVLALALLLLLAWLAGARATGGWQVLLVLALDLAWAGWAVRRLGRRPWRCSTCRRQWDPRRMTT